MNSTNCGLSDQKWHVVYTMPKAERKVASSITAMGIEAYLPLHKVIRQWSDRKKRLELPLFPNYVFVKVDRISRVSLYSIKELVKFVSIDKQPVVVSEKEIMTIKKVLTENVQVRTEDYFLPGMRIKIADGQFAGLEGIIERRNSDTRLIIKIEGLMKAFSFNIPSQLLEAVS